MTAAEMQARTDLIKRLDRVIEAKRDWQTQMQDRVIADHTAALVASRALPVLEAADHIAKTTERCVRRVTAIMRAAQLTRDRACRAYRAALDELNR